MRIIFTSIFFAFVFNSFGQFIQSELKDSVISSLYEIDFENKLYSKESDYFDTLQISEVNQPSIFYNLKTNLGNNGSPLLPLTFSKFCQPIGFFGQFDFLGDYRFHESNSSQYEVNKAFTEFQYLNGSNSEERFSVVHIQNIKKSFNTGFKFNSLKSEGIYARQFLQHRNFSFFSNYSNKKRNYYAETGFHLNKSLLFENGGLTSPNLIIDNSLPKNLLPVNLEQATNKSENRSFYYNHFYLPFSKNVSDSLNQDSIELIRSIVLYQKFNFNQTNYLFADLAQDSNYYENIGMTSTSEYWSKQNFQVMNNSFGILLQPKRYIRSADISIDQQFVMVGNYAKSNNFNNQLFRIKGELPLFKILETKLDYSQVFSGYNSGDGRFKLNSNLDLTKFYNVGFTFQTQTTTVPYVFQNYFGTSFQYENSLQKERVNEISVNQLFYNFIKVDLGSGLYNNGVFFTENLVVNQSNTLDEYLFVNVNLKAENKRFFVSTDTRWQQFSNSLLLPLPKFISFSRVYLKGWIFDHHMFVNLGVDLFYTSQFRGFGYSPQNRQFYSNTSANRFGNYPFVDLFFAAKVKTARFFVKASHLNQGFSGNNYFLAQNYPYHDFSLRVGFAWSFLN